MLEDEIGDGASIWLDIISTVYQRFPALILVINGSWLCLSAVSNYTIETKSKIICPDRPQIVP